MQLNSFCKNLREKLHRIHTGSVGSRFKMQVTARHPSGVTDVADDLPGLHLLTGGDTDGRTVGVQCFQPAAVVDLNVVTVAAAPTLSRPLATVTMPSAAARIGVPSAQAMSVPVWELTSPVMGSTR